MRRLRKYIFSWMECAVWLIGLLWLAAIDPGAPVHFELCVFKWIGLSFCPGCGLGHSVSWLLHGEMQASLQAHPLGIFALVILTYRIIQLTRLNFTNYQNTNQRHGHNG